MAAPRVLIVRAPGTNCDEETAFAFAQAGAVPESVHIERLLEQPEVCSGYQILCVPGGFSYGDDLAAGRILAVQMQQHLGDTLRDFCTSDKLMLGICNGFQVLLKSGLLVPEEKGPAATLAWNGSGHFEDRWVELRATASQCVFLAGVDQMYLPVAHAEGRFVARDNAALTALESAGQLVLRYAGKNGQDTDVSYPANPNGSQVNVAGICDTTGRVFGLMPHPERFIDATQHPRWTREPNVNRGDGLRVFANAVRYFS